MNDKNFYQEKYVLTDLLLSTNKTRAVISKELDITVSELNSRIKDYGLEWISHKKRKMSRGQAAVVDILRKVLPNEKIEFEHHVGNRLLLDIYIPTYKMGIEYHGRQHFDWVRFFHNSYEEFEEAVERDIQKEIKCRELGITLVVFRYDDKLTEDFIYNRVLSEVRSFAPAKGLYLEADKKKQRRLASKKMRLDIKKERDNDPELQLQKSERKQEARARRKEWLKNRPNFPQLGE
jgi:hypothetical protein